MQAYTRERWKQVSSADSSMLSRFKIKHLFHVITYDEDLSDDKITLLGAQRHIFYLPDNSRTMKRAQGHTGLKEYVRPISRLINDIKKEMGLQNGQGCLDQVAFGLSITIRTKGEYI